MPRSSFDMLADTCRPVRLAALLGCLCLQQVVLASPLYAAPKIKEDFSATLPTQMAPPASPGAIFQSGTYVPLTSGARAGRVGDLLTIVLVEQTNASKANSAGTNRKGSVGITPPPTGPLSLIKPSDVNMGGDQSFTGKGAASQSNSLSGEISVTIVTLYPNGTMLVRGEKRLTLNRGDEFVQVSGIVRAADITSDNRVPSTRIADARISYVGRGEIARGSQQGWLQRFFSKISPF
jgi:flagellar L-ring protein FlgH